MTILHLYPKDDTLIAAHVQLLAQTCNPAFVHYTETDNSQGERLADIIHVHGCWNYTVAHRAMKAHRNRARVVFSPHGGLDPWILNERRITEKLGKELLWQRKLAESAYVTIAHSPIEADNLHTLNWNPRVETIRNATVTNSITPEAMGRQTHDIYRKVMDSNTLELMDDDTRMAMAILLRAAITGDRRYVADKIDSTAAGHALVTGTLPEESWRKMLIYAEHENIRDLIERGISLLSPMSPITPTFLSYLPTSYVRPVRQTNTVMGYVREMNRTMPTMLLLIQMEESLRKDAIQDEPLVAAFENEHLLKFFQRTLQLLREQTFIEDGFLPCDPLDDKQTDILRNQLSNHQRI